MTSLLGLLYPCLPLGWVSFERTEGQRGSESNGYTSMVGVSDESDTIPHAAATGAYSTGRRGIAYPPGVRR